MERAGGRTPSALRARRGRTSKASPAMPFGDSSKRPQLAPSVSPKRGRQHLHAQRGPNQEPSHWPPEVGYKEATNGWHISSGSTEWLHKPSTGIYFHCVTETLWRRAHGDRYKFVRVDAAGLEGVAVAAFGDTAPGQRVLLRICLESWRQQLHKFEDMDRDLSEKCDEARMEDRPRTSEPRTPKRGDQGIGALLQPVTEHVQWLLAESSWAVQYDGSLASTCSTPLSSSLSSLAASTKTPSSTSSSSGSRRRHSAGAHMKVRTSFSDMPIMELGIVRVSGG